MLLWHAKQNCHLFTGYDTFSIWSLLGLVILTLTLHHKLHFYGHLYIHVPNLNFFTYTTSLLVNANEG